MISARGSISFWAEKPAFRLSYVLTRINDINATLIITSISEKAELGWEKRAVIAFEFSASSPLA